MYRNNILGNFLHGYFENYASDENLDETIGFGINQKAAAYLLNTAYIFLTCFPAGWAKAEFWVPGNCSVRKSKAEIIDRVQATVLYKGGLVNFYHGFDQPDILDRQEMRLLFERGEITLNGWVPVKMKLHGLLSKEQLETIRELYGTSFNHSSS